MGPDACCAWGQTAWPFKDWFWKLLPGCLGAWVCLLPEQPFPDHGRWAISISDKITAPKLNTFHANIPLFGNQGEAKSEWRDSGIDGVQGEEVGNR